MYTALKNIGHVESQGTFLKLVVEGEQDQAEALLQKNKDLALIAGDVTDLSDRTLIKKYLSDEEATKQIQAMETGSWVPQHDPILHLFALPKWPGPSSPPPYKSPMQVADRKACHALLVTRIQQRDALITELTQKAKPAAMKM